MLQNIYFYQMLMKRVQQITAMVVWRDGVMQRASSYRKW
jgi:hypothetical protein